MKKIISTLFSLVFAISFFAQQAPPQGINYQAMVYVPYGNQQVGVNSAGQIPANTKQVLVKFTLEEGNNGPVIYEETHIDTTDQYGLLNTVIGTGTPSSNSPGLFNQINWSLGDPYLRVSITLTQYNSTVSSYQKLWSVPYALYADHANSADYATSSGHADSSDYASQAGNGITGVTDNGDGTLTFTYLDGSSYTTGPLTSLGTVGPQGPAGANGQSAYDLWLAQGNTGTQQDFLNSLQGATGAQGSAGANGQSAYDLWLAQGNTGTQQDFLNSLQGATGPQGPAGATGLTGPQGIQGVAGTPGAAGANGTNGKNTVVKTTTEAVGANCATGGVKIEYGLDANINGVLDAGEINSALTKYVCNGAQGTPGSQNAWSLTGNAGTNPTTNFIGTTDAQDWSIKTNNTERMRVTSGGNVGIGTSVPLYKLSTVDDGLGITMPFGITDLANNPRFRLDVEGDATTSITNVKFDVYPLINTDQAQIRFFRATNTTGPKSIEFFRGNNTTESSARIGIDGLSSYFQLQGGNFGIGTNSPTGTLHVVNTNGNLKVHVTGSTEVERVSGTPLYVTSGSNDNSQNLGMIGFQRGTGAGESAFITTTGDGSNGISAIGFGFQTPGIRFRVLYNGNVGIGTNTPDALLSVNGTASKVGGGSWATFSDRRVKYDINQFNDGLDVLMKLNPVTFKYNEKSGYTDVNKTFVGFIAQDVETVAPYMVEIYNDSEGPSGLSDKRQFDESALNKILVNAVQEQQAQIEQLKKELEEMKSIVKELKKN
jgi:hypothetical protein